MCGRAGGPGSSRARNPAIRFKISQMSALFLRGALAHFRNSIPAGSRGFAGLSPWFQARGSDRPSFNILSHKFHKRSFSYQPPTTSGKDSSRETSGGAAGSAESAPASESSRSELDVVPEEPDSGSDGDDKKFRFLPFGIYGGATIVFSGFALSYYLDHGKDLKLSQLLDDATQYMYDTIDRLFPSDDTPLLPDFDELNYPPNLPTLVIDLDKVVALMEYDRKLGWRVKKRPHADRFFKELMTMYEIVIWSDDPFPVATEVANLWGLPVIGCIHRDHCKKHRGGYIKDLSKLGRDLRRVVLVDHDRVACSLQEGNAILVKEFDGDEADEELLLLIGLLKSIAMNPQDVTEQIRKLGGGQDRDIGRRFAEQWSATQQKTQSRMNLTRMLGFRHLM